MFRPTFKGFVPPTLIRNLEGVLDIPGSRRSGQVSVPPLDRACNAIPTSVAIRIEG